eukprot:TRINITY_DN6489_c0_g1_i1.p1 TRINITY_DN6489_c0_g1~~TRINITY_DN6489_c0_g1_i1.p1  ORF type:complete len:119 (+),score=13.90 TRINITY_DN6489_c0_g1_i1:187-543(+)
MVVNTEVAIGDLGEALPFFLKNLAACLLAAMFVGSIGFLYGSQSKGQALHNFGDQVQRIEKERRQVDEKQRQKDLLNNPWKLNSWLEVYPKHLYGGEMHTDNYIHKSEVLEKVRKTNK